MQNVLSGFPNCSGKRLHILKDRIRKLFSNVWNIPNVLTMIRLLLIPVFVVVFFSTPHDRNKIAALVIFAVASITDMFDGRLARKLNQITDFGKVFDPLADNAIIIVGVKELIMLLGGVFMLSKNVVVYSNYVGKTAQVFFIASLILSFFHPGLEAGNVCLFGMTADRLLLWATVVLCLAALVVYTAGAVKTLKEKKE